MGSPRTRSLPDVAVESFPACAAFLANRRGVNEADSEHSNVRDSQALGERRPLSDTGAANLNAPMSLALLQRLVAAQGEDVQKTAVECDEVGVSPGAPAWTVPRPAVQRHGSPSATKAPVAACFRGLLDLSIAVRLAQHRLHNAMQGATISDAAQTDTARGIYPTARLSIVNSASPLLCTALRRVSASCAAVGIAGCGFLLIYCSAYSKWRCLPAGRAQVGANGVSNPSRVRRSKSWVQGEVQAGCGQLSKSRCGIAIDL